VFFLYFYYVKTRKQLYEIIEKQAFLLEKALSEIVALKAEIALLKSPKNSSNSSIPPSKDENRPLKNQSLRAVSGKKIGGQEGHKGSTLLFFEPTNVIKDDLNFCSECGKSLENIAEVLLDKRQVIEIPFIKPIVNEYQRISKTCTCGHCTKTMLPSHISAPVQYGASVETMVAYMSARQYMPFGRMQEYFSSVFNLKISQGTIQNILLRVSNILMPAYDLIKVQIESAFYLGGDETSIKINGIKNWFWTLQNHLYTFIICTNNRAFETLNQLFPNGLPNAIIGHDCYSAWFKLFARLHQACLAHIQRDIKYFIESYPSCQWIKDVKQLFYDAIEWSKTERKSEQDYKKRLFDLIDNPPLEIYSQLKPFVKRLSKYRESLLTFLDYDFVPSDNNGSERAIRNVKVKAKVSNQFKTIENANIFAIIRSVIDTLIKNKRDVLPNLFQLINIRPE
jgi:transposase